MYSTNSSTKSPWSQSPPDPPRPPSVAYWRPPDLPGGSHSDAATPLSGPYSSVDAADPRPRFNSYPTPISTNPEPHYAYMGSGIAVTPTNSRPTSVYYYRQASDTSRVRFAPIPLTSQSSSPRPTFRSTQPRSQLPTPDAYRSNKDELFASARVQQQQQYTDAQHQARLIDEKEVTLKRMEERQRKAQATDWFEEGQRLAVEATRKQEEERRSGRRPHQPEHAYIPKRYKSIWRTAQEEARYVIKVEQERLDRLFASEAEALKRAEEALAQRQTRASVEGAEYDERLLADEEGRVQHERTRVAELRTTNLEWLSHLIKQETDRIHAAMINDELEGRLTPEESQWLENNIQKRKAEEERQSLKRAQEEEAERLRKLEEEEEAAKIRAAQAEELAEAARRERLALPPIPPSEEESLAHDPTSSVDVSLEEGIADQESTAHNSIASSESTISIGRASVESAEEPSSVDTADAARRAWANNLISEWERRGAHEEHHHHPKPHARHHQSTPSFSYRYRPANAEEIRRHHEHVEEVKHREREAAHAAREAREARAARKAFEEERKRLEKERRKKEDERRKNEEQIGIASWQRYERNWQDLTNGVFPEGRQLTFYDIPWPVCLPARSVDELQSAAIEKFLLNPSHSPAKTRRVRISDALIRWNLDNFTGSFRSHIDDNSWSAITAGVTSVLNVLELLDLVETAGQVSASLEENDQEQSVASNPIIVVHPSEPSGDPSEIEGREIEIPVGHQQDLSPISDQHIEQLQPSVLVQDFEQAMTAGIPISRRMTTPEVVSHLVVHGCRDLTGDVDHASFGDHAAFHGGFSDIYAGFMRDGTNVAIKALRISIKSIAESPTHLKANWDGIALDGPGKLAPYLERTPGVNLCKLCVQICDGLSYLHEIGIIHADLKGANILISDDGEPVLTDFGNSLHEDQSMKFTRTTTSKSGTMRWSAPELIEDSAENSKETDVYALGMTIYEVMAGAIPYKGKKDSSIWFLVVNKRMHPERPKSIPTGREEGERLWNLLVDCWAFDPKMRPSASAVGTTMRTITPDGLTPITSSTSTSWKSAPEHPEHPLDAEQSLRVRIGY